MSFLDFRFIKYSETIHSCATGESAKHFSLPGDTVVAMLSSLFCITKIFGAKKITKPISKYYLVLKRRILSYSRHAKQSIRYREKLLLVATALVNEVFVKHPAFNIHRVVRFVS